MCKALNKESSGKKSARVLGRFFALSTFPVSYSCSQRTPLSHRQWTFCLPPEAF